MKTEEYYRQKIGETVRRIMNEEHNKEATAKFLETLNKIKPKSCEVKSGWKAGEGIDFSLAYEKNGTGIPFDLFIENIPDLIETYGFICGLNPGIFHLNPATIISDETYVFLTFKLLRDESGNN